MEETDAGAQLVDVAVACREDARQARDRESDDDDPECTCNAPRRDVGDGEDRQSPW